MQEDPKILIQELLLTYHLQVGTESIIEEYSSGSHDDYYRDQLFVSDNLELVEKFTIKANCLIEKQDLDNNYKKTILYELYHKYVQIEDINSVTYRKIEKR